MIDPVSPATILTFFNEEGREGKAAGRRTATDVLSVHRVASAARIRAVAPDQTSARWIEIARKLQP